jgi:hypothetical protein
MPTLFGGAPDPARGFSYAGSAVNDIFAGFAAQEKAKGDLLEGQNYGLAAQYALQEAKFTAQSTAIQTFQQQRETTKALGQTAADVAGAGFAESGSALDLLRESASQGALAKAVLSEQGLITEAGYEEQAKSYANMQTAANMAASADKTAATGDFIAGGVRACDDADSMTTGSNPASKLPPYLGG